MRNQKLVKFIIAAVTLCMLLSVAPAFAFAEEGDGEPFDPSLLVVTIDDSDCDSRTSSGEPNYWYDTAPHYPLVTVTYDGEPLEEGLGKDYYVKCSFKSVAGEPVTDDLDTVYNDGDYELMIDLADKYGVEAVHKTFHIIRADSIWPVYHRNYDSADTVKHSGSNIIYTWTINSSHGGPQETYTRDGYTFDGWYTDSECTGTKVDFDVPFYTYNDHIVMEHDPDNAIDRYYIHFYAKWVKDEGSGGDDPTPGGDDPVPGGDGTDDTDGGKPSPDTGVDNMFPLFMWLLAASGLIIFSIRKKRA